MTKFITSVAVNSRMFSYCYRFCILYNLSSETGSWGACPSMENECALRSGHMPTNAHTQPPNFSYLHTLLDLTSLCKSLDLFTYVDSFNNFVLPRKSYSWMTAFVRVYQSYCKKTFMEQNSKGTDGLTKRDLYIKFRP